jgi:predicted CXXCH cytochrome family protein
MTSAIRAAPDGRGGSSCRRRLQAAAVVASLAGGLVASVAAEAVAAGRAAATTAASPDGGMGWTDGACGGCHVPEPGFTHPVGFVPGMTVPDALPLDRGRVVCTTCHLNGLAADHARARGDHSSLLRVPAGALCTACHDLNRGRRADLHPFALGRAHLLWASSGGRTIPREASGSVAAMDTETRRCLTCHDGSVARGIGGSEDGDSPSAHGVGRSHPVDVPYPTGGRRGPDAGLRPAASLDERIRLFDERVGCGSCHSLFSREEALLVMPNRLSALCLSCHDV